MTETARRLLGALEACGDDEDPGRPARGAGRARRQAGGAGRRTPAPVRRPGGRWLRAHQVALPALHLRPHLPGQGPGDDARRVARARRASSRGALPDRGPHPSAGRPPRGRGVPPQARAPGHRPRGERPRRVRRSLPLRRRARRSARSDGCLRHAVSRPRADRLRGAHVRDRRRLRHRLDAVLVRRGHARLGCRHDRPVRRPGGSDQGGLRLHRAPEPARRGPARGPPARSGARLALRRRGDRGGPARGDRGRSPAEAAARGRAGARRDAHRPPAHARRRLRNRPARARCDSEPAKRLLRRRCRATRSRSRSSWSSAPATRAGSRCSIARSPSSATPPTEPERPGCATS